MSDNADTLNLVAGPNIASMMTEKQKNLQHSIPGAKEVFYS